MKEILLRIADRLKDIGSEYYDKGEREKCVIFWELEAIIRGELEKEE